MHTPGDSFALLNEVIDNHEFGFADAVVISGIGARQLRNGLDRGVLTVGRKLPSVDRWVFSMRECLQLMIVGDLTTSVWMPLAQAAEIGREVARSFDTWMTKFSTMKTTEDMQAIYEFIAYAEDGQTRLMMHQRGGDGGFFTLEGDRLDLKSWQQPHVRVSVLGLIIRLMNGIGLAGAQP